VSNEPKQLARGRRFHEQVQEEWLTTTFGAALSERPINLATKDGSPRRGRIDVRMIDPDEPMAFVVEIKDSNFDQMTDRAVRRNAGRHRLQVSRYGDAFLTDSAVAIEFVCLAIVYSTEPQDFDRRDWIEQYLAGYMTACFWRNTDRGAPLY
jgi:hypothetical protein